jgi:uncharacterized phage infection (PIP) family protein YhgE
MTGTVRPGHLVGLAIAAVVMIAAAVFMVGSWTYRDDAADDVRQAHQQRARQRVALEDAKDQLVAARSAAAATSNAFRQVLALEQQLADTMNQGVDADKTAQSLGATEAPDVARYNAAIDQANAMADQYNATIEQIRQLIQAIPKQTVGAAK